MKIEAGDILLFHGEKGISKLIAWQTKSLYSHIAICVSPEMSLIIEANAGGGVRACDIRQIQRKYDVFRVKNNFKYDLFAVISFLVNKLNSKYDYIGVFYLGFLKLLGLKKKANKLQKDSDWFCSELAYSAFNAGGLDIVPHVDSAEITAPSDIANSKVIQRVEQ